MWQAISVRLAPSVRLGNSRAQQVSWHENARGFTCSHRLWAVPSRSRPAFARSRAAAAPPARVRATAIAQPIPPAFTVICGLRAGVPARGRSDVAVHERSRRPERLGFISLFFPPRAVGQTPAPPRRDSQRQEPVSNAGRLPCLSRCLLFRLSVDVPPFRGRPPPLTSGSHRLARIPARVWLTTCQERFSANSCRSAALRSRFPRPP
jgi:hypothetical protein